MQGGLFPFFTDLSICAVVPLIYTHRSLLATVEQHFSSFLKFVITEVLPVSLTGPALAHSPWKWLELALSDMGAAPGVCLQKAAMQLPRYQNLAT